MAKKPQTEKLFKEELVPAKAGTGELFEASYDDSEPVECLGLKFENDAARIEHFTNSLRAKLADPDFRKLGGFPEGDDEDILAMSDPPYYTACPNPFLADFVNFHASTQSEKYHREPFTTDVSEGKNDQLYNAHSYHTKVPYKAIIRYLLHYTQPGDIVLDGFCGTGMAGVAAELCGRRKLVESLGYKVENDGTILNESGKPYSNLGKRFAVLNDLSPIATFIAYNYNEPVDPSAFGKAGADFFQTIDLVLGSHYTTTDDDGIERQVGYIVWSEVFLCPECGGEIVYVNEALNRKTRKVRKTFPCPHCGAAVEKRLLQKFKEQFHDAASNASFERNRRIPLFISYNEGKKKCEKNVDDDDLKLINSFDYGTAKEFFPAFKLPYAHMTHERVRIADYGVSHLHHFFLPRQLNSLAIMWDLAKKPSDLRTRQFLKFMVEQCFWGMSVLARYAPTHYSQVNQYLSGVFYVGSQIVEVSPWYILDGKYKRLQKAVKTDWPSEHTSAITTGDCANIPLPDDSIDYIFTDPPFGENIYYADLNILNESWHRVRTNAVNEAIVDKAKKKGILEYQEAMRRCFKEYQRVLKSGRWITIVFHNSHNSVWNAIQEALLSAGFVVADVRTLDKQQGSYRQVTSTAVKQDLVVSAYKPSGGLEQRFRISAGTEQGVWEFVETHLGQLPVFVAKNNKSEIIAERQSYLLYDRMVAFHVQRGVTVPMSSAEFHAGLGQKFPERDGMHFLADQVAEYDRKRMTVNEVEQLDLFVTDEASAIQWLKKELKTKPQTFQELQPQFMQELAGWQKFERTLELSELLEQNFLCYDEKDDVPSQIHGYLSSNFKDVRKLAKTDATLKGKAKGRWYVPDSRKEVDMEKVRHKALMKEFNEYQQAKGKLKTVRSEALRAGFKDCWQNNDYQGIVKMAERVREEIIQEDPALLMYYDNALMLSAG